MNKVDYGNTNKLLFESIGQKSDNKPKGKRRSSLPSYWVNLEELAQILTDIVNSSKFVDYGKQKIDGLILNVDNTKVEQEIAWQPKQDFTVLTGIEFSANDVRNIGYNNSFDMYIDDELYFEDIYIKETNEYKRFNVRKLIHKDNKIRFLFKNKDKMIENIFFHIHYIGDIPVKKYNIICIDINTGETILQYEIFLIPPSKQTVCPPEIEQYISLSEECVEINTETSDDNNIIFEYEKEEQVIEHDYDWICKLYWQSHIDLDFHCEIDGLSEINYRNKEIGIDDENKGWLDYDYTSWQETPEIITILGLKDKNATIKVNHFSGSLNDNEEILVTIGKRDKKSDIILKEYKIKGSQLQYKIPTSICKINLQDEKIQDLI